MFNVELMQGFVEQSVEGNHTSINRQTHSVEIPVSYWPELIIHIFKLYSIYDTNKMM